MNTCFVHENVFSGYAHVYTFDYVYRYGCGGDLCLCIYAQKAVCIVERMHLGTCLIVFVGTMLHVSASLVVVCMSN